MTVFHCRGWQEALLTLPGEPKSSDFGNFATLSDQGGESPTRDTFAELVALYSRLLQESKMSRGRGSRLDQGGESPTRDTFANLSRSTPAFSRNQKCLLEEAPALTKAGSHLLATPSPNLSRSTPTFSRNQKCLLEEAPANQGGESPTRDTFAELVALYSHLLQESKMSRGRGSPPWSRRGGRDINKNVAKPP